MESPTGGTMLEDRLPADQPGFRVKNTFLEVEGDSDGSLDLGDSWMRASTEPAKVFSVSRRPSQSKLGPLEGDPDQDVYEPGQPSSHGRALKEPQYVYMQQAAYADAAGREAAQPGRAPLDGNSSPAQDAFRALEMDPELAPAFESIKAGGAEAAIKYFRDQNLMQKISRKMDELKLPPLQQPHPSSKDGAMDVAGLLRALSGMEDNVVQQVTLSAIRNMPCSVTLADPSLDDCPLIGVSEGFEALTGFSDKEVVGKNCRFLSRGENMDPNMRQALRDAVNLGREFIGVLPNVRRNGEPFSNLLRMTTTYVRGKRFIIGVQADVTDIDIDLGNPVHVEELWNAARRIFSSNIDAWVQMQDRQFRIRQPVPYSDILKADAPQLFQEAQGQFVVMNTGEKGGGFLSQPEAAAKTAQGNSPTTNERKLPSSERSTSAASIAGGDRSEESADGSRSTPARGPLRSIGSAGHPDACNSECIFYFFRDGCRAGENCRFCHEFHRRKNMKKNRRILKRICGETGGSGTAEEDAQSRTGASEKASEKASVSGGEKAAARQAPAAASRQAPAPAPTPAPAPAPCEAAPALGAVRLWYGPESTHPGVVQSLMLAVGCFAELPAHVEVTAERQKELQPFLTFAVDPALPAGLICDSRTGQITGIPEVSQPARDHTFTASIAATGPGGINLGQVHLATCRLTLGVLDLQQFALSWGQADSSGDGRVTLTFQAR